MPRATLGLPLCGPPSGPSVARATVPLWNPYAPMTRRIFFDFLTVHGAPGFPHPGRRRILSLRYLSADARHAPRAWRTSPPFDDLDAELPAGADMDHPLFPVVWPA